MNEKRVRAAERRVVTAGRKLDAAIAECQRVHAEELGSDKPEQARPATSPDVTQGLDGRGALPVAGLGDDDDTKPESEVTPCRCGGVRVVIREVDARPCSSQFAKDSGIRYSVTRLGRRVECLVCGRSQWQYAA